MPAPPHMQRLIISAPFGNYVQPKGCTATLGTFTVLNRPGRIRRVLASVRYYRRLKAWVNKLGLRNPGIDWLCGRVESGRIDPRDKIVSIHGIEAGDWDILLGRVAGLRPLAVELNMSCPNIGEINWPASLFADAVLSGVPVIVKLPPVHYHGLLDMALEAGVRVLHCCNTLPVPAGGISGKPLKPVALQCIRDIRGRTAGMGSELTLIGGGGITHAEDIDEYRRAGATYFAVGTKVFNPRYLFSHGPLADLIRRANAV